MRNYYRPDDDAIARYGYDPRLGYLDDTGANDEGYDEE